MIREKSCGPLVYRKKQDRLELLLIRHKNGGHWSFPKGHVETGETEPQTALREIKEETGLDVGLCEGFRQSVEYFPKPHVKKPVSYKHLDVYKRQGRRRAELFERSEQLGRGLMYDGAQQIVQDVYKRQE